MMSFCPCDQRHGLRMSAVVLVKSRSTGVVEEVNLGSLGPASHPVFVEPLDVH